MEIDRLYLGDWQFPVLKGKTKLHGLISNATDFKLFWMINIYCDDTEVTIDGDKFYLRPRLYFESMRLAVRDWKQIEGMHCYSNAADDNPPAVCLFEHEDIDASDIHFVARNGTTFDVDWTFSSSTYTGRVRTSVPLTNVSVWLEDVDDVLKAQNRLSQDLDLSCLSEPETVAYPNAGLLFRFNPVT